MRKFNTVLFIATCFTQTVVAEEGVLLGDWRGLDRASNAIYSTIHIADKQIAWGGGNPYNPSCKTTYTIVDNYSSTAYPGNPFQVIPRERFVIYKLKLEPNNCSNEGYYQFAILTNPGTGKKPKGVVAYVVTYGQDEHQTGWHTFSKEGSYQSNMNQK